MDRQFVYESKNNIYRYGYFYVFMCTGTCMIVFCINCPDRLERSLIYSIHACNEITSITF